jgi:GAF domain-containing protein
LEQQTATAEVLGVINSSPGDLGPVFDAILEKAMHRCEASCATLYTLEGERARLVALRGASDIPEWMRQQAAFDPPPGSSIDRLQQGDRFVHLLDATNTEAYRASPAYKDMIDASGCRSSIAIPLRKEGALLGVIAAYRQEVRPFTDKQIALLQNFAAQAVIAMENARLITETREALEQQTATAEVLQVINASPGNLTPVFDAMLERALALCGASFEMMNTYDGQQFHAAAERGVPEALAEFRRQNPLVFMPGTGPARILSGESVVHRHDVMDQESYRDGDPMIRNLVDLGRARSLLVVALRKEETLLGTLSVYRQEVRPFSDKEIALLQNFAAQAVIAMENARLLTETREGLEQQTATAEVVQVINSSPGDLGPVFEAMLEKAIRLCGGIQGALWTRDEERAKVAASYGNTPEFVALLREHAALDPPAAVRETMRGDAD